MEFPNSYLGQRKDVVEIVHFVMSRKYVRDILTDYQLSQ
jgi:hypothetical protein